MKKPFEYAPSGIMAYLWTAIAIAVVAVISWNINVHEIIKSSGEPETAEIFLLIAIAGFLSFLSANLAEKIGFPAFVVAIFFGMAAKPFFEPIVSNGGMLSALVTGGAALILFGGGLETPLKNFMRLFGKIMALAVPGVLITAFLLSLAVIFFGRIFGADLSIATAILLGAILASTDPAAIIPLLQNMKFKKRDAKDIVVSESAVNDVVGAILTLFFVGWLATGLTFESVSEGYASLFTVESAKSIFWQMAKGVAFGAVGYFILHLLSGMKQKKAFKKDSGADKLFFVIIPIVAYMGAMQFQGSGFLAAFIAGLLFHVVDHMHEVEKFFNDVVDGLFKPGIFFLLGAMVNIQSLWSYAYIGIPIALAFMFIIRPAMVFAMLSPFMFFGKEKLSFQEMVFISWVRETGVIPAVLLIAVISKSIPDIKGLYEIGMWVILITLIVQPVLTPLLAKKLKLTEGG
ncbi:cation:proton antiporter [Candidatus Azambacteria bacterium]|nr:cation:proton antiporter [Candidatus Azambacteria bacterium]